MTARGRFLIDVPIGEDWKLIEELRTGVLSCLASVVTDPGSRDLTAMVVSELLEHALKYGAWTSPASCRLEIEGGTNSLSVSVSHPVRAGPDLERLFKTLENLGDPQRREDAYVQRMRELAEQGEGRSGLGLLRVAHEGGCSLSATVSPDGTLTVTAVSRLP